MTTPTAMVIEDDEDIAFIFSEALRAAGFEVEIARTGGEAIARLDTATPDVVVLDMFLPEVSGQSILDRIRSDPRLAGSRVIVATADARLAETLHTQADLVLVKPISPLQLRDLARRMRP